MSETPHLGSVKPGPRVGILLYALLGVSAAVALLGGPAQFDPARVRVLGAGAFAGFLAVFAAYRFSLVRAGRGSPGKAFFQLGAGALLLVVLARGAYLPLNVEPAEDEFTRLLSHPDPSVRRLACEVARYRADGPGHAPQLRQHLDDPSTAVRQECQRSLDALDGVHPPAVPGR